jgi:hypothetical protein
MNTITFMNRRTAAKYLREHRGVRCSEKFLSRLAAQGEGPRFADDGLSAWYTPQTLDAWLGDIYSAYAEDSNPTGIDSV